MTAASKTTAETDRVQAWYDEIAPALYSWARLRLGRAGLRGEAPEDLTQEVWLRVLEAGPPRGDSLAAVRSWVFGIAVNVCYEWMRRTARASTPPRDSSRFDRDPTSLTARWRRQVAATDALQRILRFVERDASALDTEILIHRGLQGLPHGQTAALVGRSEQTVKNRWTALRRRLEREFPAPLIDQLFHG